MELSAEMFEQTIRLFKGDGATIKNQRRAHPRVGIRCRITIIPIEAHAAAKPLEVWTRDFSRSGVGIISSHKLNVGSQFIVRFPRGDEKPLALICTIKCCSPLSDGIYTMGAVFEGIDKNAVAAA
jgi:hypothetical protein